MATHMGRSELRVAVYSDLVYRSDGTTISTDLSFVRLPASLPPRVDEVVVLGRLDPSGGRAPYALPADGVRFVALPHYPSVWHVGAVARALLSSTRIFVRELHRVDAVWLFGPHPLALLFALAARARRVPVILGVRQDYPRYVADRLPGRGWAWAIVVARLLDEAWRLLARGMPTVALGSELAKRYRGGSAPVLETGFSLVGTDDIVPAATALEKSWDGELRVVSVGRLDPEKNPLLLLDVIDALRRRDERWRLAVVGDGSLAEELARAVRDRGLGEHVELLGAVANGPALWEEYRRSVAFLHVSLTEGLPQVLFEAHAAGIPIVATDVGGVAAALAGGRTGLLVPPKDARAAAAALERLRDEPELRRSLVEAGHASVSQETLDAQLDRFDRFIRDAVARAAGTVAAP
jgi:glycosyltransferase involved in cell wall biosynthesis